MRDKGTPKDVCGEAISLGDTAQNIPLTQALNPLSCSEQILFYRKHSLGAPGAFTVPAQLRREMTKF